ncbi:tetratricopeptide repeat protein [Nonomuraea sp. NPDC050153]|uniref:tetratricopeptide repeat protein n=1 Tax=Nonomuraea sp. NPDC050153 TaxID=3364359 RepID=UPI0037BC1291
MVDQIASLGEIAHIVGDSPNGPRGVSPLTPEERNRCDNLILLCSHHHQLIDSQPKTWTVDRLLAMKQAHEQRVLRRLGAIDAVTTAGTSGEPVDSDYLDWFVRLGDALPRVCDVTNRAVLGIHAARPLPKQASEELSPELPTYIPRDIDAELRRYLEGARSGGGFAVLLGAATAGKTRSAFEAIRAVLPEWGFILPPSPDDLVSLIDSGIPLGRCVIWLDRLAGFLESGRLSSGTVRRLLGNTQEPIVLMGTLWSTDYERFHELASASGMMSTSGEARAVLSLAQLIDLPERFSDSEAARTLQIALVDPRVKEAAAAVGDGAPPAVLACAPELLRRRAAPGNAMGAAVITAAVEARFCGHPDVIPPSLLQRLAEEYLTPAQRALAEPDWFASAISWACRPVLGEVAPMSPSALKVGELDGYAVSDVLVYHESRKWSTARRVPDTPWDILVAETDLDACAQVGMRAMMYGLVQYVIPALTRVADAGDGDALFAFALAMAHYDQGDLESARTWFLKAHDVGHVAAAGMLAVVHKELGDLDGARSWLRRGAEAGDPGAMAGWGSELEDDGDLDSARYWYERSAQDPNGYGSLFLGTFLRNHGDLEGARDWFRKAADHAQAEAAYVLPHLLAGDGDQDAPGRKIRQTYLNNFADAAARLGEVHRALGESDTAYTWLNQAAGFGNIQAMAQLGAMLWDLDRYDEAVRWLEPAADAGNHDAMFYLALIMDDRGDTARAGAWLAKAADGGAPYAMGRFALHLLEHGDIDEATSWAQRAHEAGDPLIEHAFGSVSERMAQTEERTQSPNSTGDIYWTPFEHPCGCVIDWGWSSQEADPRSFIAWCTYVINEVCPWHAEGSTIAPEARKSMVFLRWRAEQGGFFAREATGHDVELGCSLTESLRTLIGQIASATENSIDVEIPAAYSAALRRHGFDPRSAWFEQRLTDIILNRGESELEPLLRTLESREGDPER